MHVGIILQICEHIVVHIYMYMCYTYINMPRLINLSRLGGYFDSFSSLTSAHHSLYQRLYNIWSVVNSLSCEYRRL